MRREEKLDKIKKVPKYRGRAARNAFGSVAAAPSGFVFNDGGAAGTDNTPDKYDEINGEKVLREYGPFGLRNALHLIVKTPQQTLFNYILSLKVQPDEPDYD